MQTACACGPVGPFASLVTRRRRSSLRFFCDAYRVCLWRLRSLRFARHTTASHIASLLLRCKRACLWRHRSLRFARHMTASLIASLLLRCIPRVPVAPSVPLLRPSHDDVAHCFAFLRCKQRVPVAPSVPSLRSSQDGVARRFASFAMHTACACGAFGPFASLVTRRRRILLRFSCVANARAFGAIGPFASLVT